MCRPSCRPWVVPCERAGVLRTLRGLGPETALRVDQTLLDGDPTDREDVGSCRSTSAPPVCLPLSLLVGFCLESPART